MTSKSKSATIDTNTQAGQKLASALMQAEERKAAARPSKPLTTIVAKGGTPKVKEFYQPTKVAGMKYLDPKAEWMPVHPVCSMFGHDDDDIDAIAASIKEQGLLEPVTVYDDKILDGQGRYAACRKLCVEPRTMRYSGNDPIGFVMAKNVARRHLSKARAAQFVLFDRTRKGEKTRSKVTLKEQCAKLGIGVNLVRDLKKLREVAPAVADKVVKGEPVDGKVRTVTNALTHVTGVDSRKAKVTKKPCKPSSTPATREAAAVINRAQKKAAKAAPISNVAPAKKPESQAERYQADKEAVDLLIENLAGQHLGSRGVLYLREQIERFCDQRDKVLSDEEAAANGKQKKVA